MRGRRGSEGNLSDEEKIESGKSSRGRLGGPMSEVLRMWGRNLEKPGILRGASGNFLDRQGQIVDIGRRMGLGELGLYFVLRAFDYFDRLSINSLRARFRIAGGG